MTARRLFAITLAATALAVLGAGWLTDLRVAMHAAFLTVAVVALWPIVLVGALLLALLGVAMFIGLVSHSHVPIEGPAELVMRGGKWLVPRWARFLARQRHPIVLGVAAGVLLGGLVSGACIAILIVPGEGRTASALLAAKTTLEASYLSAGSYPREAAFTDGFGRAMRYRISGAWKLASWTLTSDGYDGHPSSDDLCISGSTQLLGLVEGLPTLTRAASIRALSCPTASPR